ncbi:YbaK/EbsC family protein [Klugiella xanthotipulae]|uniref:Prolyl-tRNA editing enzyme YbaK/EbsC (Cys-tRNA(Pro) deacylase) n=1 Tax=Klugiella xanthotipulae TaxID=244735 RepID=A0A543HYJ9_9MICO|nr:YbaK/EbsC family protein [Klugiella xanthotipulae]TQM63424.1 prolyl-tRNA editing enzyme YbaK/EbsC (Cys-tRNA(Pro) deacylase) [Klugiella xanthotipulae]
MTHNDSTAARPDESGNSQGSTVDAEHPAVAAVRVALAARGLKPTIHWLPDAAHTAPLAAEALGVPVAAIANSLIFATDIGEPVLVMTSGCHRVDTEFLGGSLGITLQRANADQVRSATGQAIGGVAPVGHPGSVRTIVDVSLAEYPTVWAAAGHPRTVFPLSFTELVHVTGGLVMPVVPPGSRERPPVG